MYDEFSGIGGTSRGATLVPGVALTDAANHDPDACAQHKLNFPDAKHYREDVTKLDMTKMPRRDIMSASPACPPWTDANGIKRDFDKSNAQQSLPGFDDLDEEEDPKLAARREQYRRARLLMHEVPRYLRAMAERGKPVLVGMVENVVQARLWSEWDAWTSEFRKIDYHFKLIAFNSMHAQPVRAKKAPQSRNRMFFVYWHRSLGRTPDFDKWLRPKAWCDTCAEVVNAMQVFKDPRDDMGVYESQYVYRCPRSTCRGCEVFPEVLPALSAIDMSNPGIRIGDRAAHRRPPLKPATLSRIRVGMKRYWAPLLVPAGGTWRSDGERGAVPLAWPAPARTTRETDGIAVPPLLVPVEGRTGKLAVPATQQARTQTTRHETGLAVLPFITPLRGGGSKDSAYPITRPAGTVTASGNHHGLATPPPTFAEPLLVPYYSSAESAHLARLPVGTLTTRERYGIATAETLARVELPDIDDVYFRMLTVDEIRQLMGFDDEFRNEAKSKRTRVRLYGKRGYTAGRRGHHLRVGRNHLRRGSAA
jgi:DNA (cytosine-5)-methyltransferase 1